MYAVTAEQTPFYKYGPQQGNGPDTQLSRNTLMTLIRPSFGFAKVRLVDGEQGFVASDDIRVAPPQLVAAVTAPTPSPIAPEPHIDLNDPRYQPPPAPLPENLPEPTPIPETATAPVP